MAIGGRGIRTVVNQREIDRFVSGDHPRRDLIYRAQRGAQEQKRLCPVSPVGASDHPSGQLRSAIGWEIGEDAKSPFVDVGVDQSSPANDYALMVVLGTRPHKIRSTGPWPLRDQRGHVFGREVDHPGTPAQDFLRPSLAVMGRARPPGGAT